MFTSTKMCRSCVETRDDSPGDAEVSGMTALAAHALDGDPSGPHGSTAQRVGAYLDGTGTAPLFLQGDALQVLAALPDDSVDCCMTSPPYWGKRDYDGGGIGLEEDHQTFVCNLLAIFAEVKRVLKPTGSLWLNLGDTYREKSLLSIPWRLAIAMTDTQGWVLRNTVIWNKVKGSPDNTPDRLRNVYEPVFHFVKVAKGYFYDVDAIRSTPRKARVENGSVISATGVSGVRYKRQIELSTALSADEKTAAFEALRRILEQVARGELADFRTTHSDAERVSGRARELKERGFYFLKYHPKGTKPGDVWDIIPEDTQARVAHFAPYPEDLCKLPLIATCPAGGVVLDPFCGIGTTMHVAQKLWRKSIGIDRSAEYIALAEKRCRLLM
jgi:site-specific DNA-methyltransferase (adenine-specific)